MWNVIAQLLSSNTYMPHGHCYLWQSPLVLLHLLSDGGIALAYFSIPFTLIYFVNQRKDVPFRVIFLLFGAFIVSCGTTHLLEIWTLWYPTYWLSGSVKLFTALISLYTAFELVPLVPQALALPSPFQLETLNRELASQISEREAAEKAVRQLNAELEQRVDERTLELQQTNQQLLVEIAERHQVELALRDSQRLFERIANLTPNILYIFNLTEQRNVYCNRFITEIFGYTPEEIQQMGANVLSDLTHPDDIERVNQHLQRAQSLRDEDYGEIEYRFKDIKGNWHWLLSRETIFERGQDGKAELMLGVASDITQRKQSELDLKQANSQLAERVEELENRTQEMVRLGEMTDFLQACLTVAEAEKTLADLLKLLLPKCSGAVFILKPSRDFLEQVAVWGDCVNIPLHFDPHECWALRRGSLHISQPTSPSLYCQHIHLAATRQTTLCIPMMAQGETLGLLYLELPPTEQFTPVQHRLAETASKQVAIALANLKLRETLQYHSLRDTLTGLFNRRYLEASIERELHRVTRENKSLGLIVMDIDHFKHFNDSFGHEAGDAVLRMVGKFLLQGVRQSDIACRYGGEEFAIILPNASLAETLERAEQIRQGINVQTVNFAGQKLDSITVSSGVASFPDCGMTFEHLFRAADGALYEAKRLGRDRVVCAKFCPVPT